MNPLQTLGLALGAGFSSGLNLYATVATLGLLQRYSVIHLPASMQVLSHPWVLGIALALYAIEFLADKIPYVDTVWDAVHTLIRPPAGVSNSTVPRLFAVTGKPTTESERTNAK